MQVHRVVFYRAQRIAGSTAVLVSIGFGKTPASGPTVTRLVSLDKDGTIKFDLAEHVSEVLAGVARANAETGSSLEVEAIEVVPDDYPGKGQAERAAYGIALAVQRGEC